MRYILLQDIRKKAHSDGFEFAVLQYNRKYHPGHDRAEIRRVLAEIHYLKITLPKPSNDTNYEFGEYDDLFGQRHSSVVVVKNATESGLENALEKIFKVKSPGRVLDTSKISVVERALENIGIRLDRRLGRNFHAAGFALTQETSSAIPKI